MDVQSSYVHIWILFGASNFAMVQDALMRTEPCTWYSVQYYVLRKQSDRRAPTLALTLLPQ